MRMTGTIARVLLGLLFFAAGLSGFIMISHPPPQPAGLAGEFQDVFFRSRWVLFVDAIELIAGALLLANRFVPLALTLLAAVLANILVFHIAMAPSSIVPGLVAAILWVIVALRHGASFAPLLVPKAEPSSLDKPQLLRQKHALA